MIMPLRRFWLRYQPCGDEPHWIRGGTPSGAIVADTPSDVLPALWEIERAVQKGLTAVGFLCFEAGAGLDPSVPAPTQPSALPLLAFGLYRELEIVAKLPVIDRGASLPEPDWSSSLRKNEYDEALRAIKSYIEDGHTYQVNYTFRLRTPFHGDAWRLFVDLNRRQPVSYSAFLDMGSHVICSLSPELFFSLNGDCITSRPMKGTAPRGRTSQEDQYLSQALYHSEKDRAENLIIVDMVRNDLGRIAEIGTVRVERMWEVERYATLHQMTTTVTARTRAPFPEMLSALFPPASVTGAPKVRTMQIIQELETSPRGIYTGAIGIYTPKRKAQFNVAIRTLHVDRDRGEAEYGVGSGIVWDSVKEAEYEECLTKAQVLFTPRPAFRLLETLRWTPARGYRLLDHHLRRLSDSARYFDCGLDMKEVRSKLRSFARSLPPTAQRVRLLVSLEGEISLQAAPLDRRKRQWRVALAPYPIDLRDPYLYHKTTRRELYRRMLESHPGFDDLILWNERGEVTESTRANLVVRLGDRWVTPPVECGLLAGTYRAYLLERGRLTEGVVQKETLRDTDAIYLINSVRGWVRVQLEQGG